MEKFLIYAIEPGGWVTSNGTLSSDWKQATVHAWPDARERCLRHRDHTGNFNWIPINRGSLLALLETDE